MTEQLPVHVPASAASLVQAPAPKPERGRLIRDLVVFQCKLLVDGFKDLVLGPLSLLAAIIDLIRGTPRSEGLFQSVLRIGAAFERSIGLYDALDAKNEPDPD